MLFLVVVGLIVLLTFGYFFLMFLYPEWVGISGEDTRKALEAHKEEVPRELETEKLDAKSDTEPTEHAE